jgi:hypothetical protein
VFSVVSAALVATQRYGKHISTAVNQQAIIEEAVFSVVADPRLYNENSRRAELELGESKVELYEVKWEEMTVATENWMESSGVG